MKIKIHHFGKIKSQEIKTLVEYYKLLSSKYFSLEIIELPDRQQAKVNATMLGEKLNNSAFNIILSEDGREFDTIVLSNKIEAIKMSHSEINIFIGNAYGFESELKAQADLVLSLSKLTFQHDFALVILLEQLFRVGNLNAGGSYHK